MKIVDLILTADANNEKRSLEKTVAIIAKKSHAARAKREEAVKLQRLKMMKFGDYIISVPVVNSSRHYDHPLTISSAEPMSEYDLRASKEEMKESGLIPGQQLYGVMIPRPHEENEKIREESIALRNNLLSRLEANKFTESLHLDEDAEGINQVMTNSSNHNSSRMEDDTNVNQDISISQRNCSSFGASEMDSDTQGFEVALPETISIYQMEQHLSKERIIQSQLHSTDTSKKEKNDVIVATCNSNGSLESRNDKSTDMLNLGSKSWETKSDAPNLDWNSAPIEVNIASSHGQEGLRKRTPLTKNDLKLNFDNEGVSKQL